MRMRNAAYHKIIFDDAEAHADAIAQHQRLSLEVWILATKVVGAVEIEAFEQLRVVTVRFHAAVTCCEHICPDAPASICNVLAKIFPEPYNEAADAQFAVLSKQTGQGDSPRAHAALRRVCFVARSLHAA